MKHVMVGFGFGPIQAGLFAKEARESGNFADIAVSEIDRALVDAVRRNGNRYAVNVARTNGLDVIQVDGVRLLDPHDKADRSRLLEMVSYATEIVTSLPSVASYSSGNGDSVAKLIAEGLGSDKAAATIVYTAENNNRAAEMLADHVQAELRLREKSRPVQFLNTVIGKMSQVVADQKMSQGRLVPIAPGFGRAFLVEEFNHILTGRISLPGFEPGIKVFEQKDNLLPFGEAKLFGHNAINTMLGFLGRRLGVELMSELKGKPDIMKLARDAFINETGAALIRKHGPDGDPLFTAEGFREFADDLLVRMVNPYLADTVERAMRDPVRKLGYSDRMFGAMRVCLEQGVAPSKLAVGAVAGLRVLLAERDKYRVPSAVKFNPDGRLLRDDFRAILSWLWRDSCSQDDMNRICDLLAAAAK